MAQWMNYLLVCPMPLPYLLQLLPFCFLFHFLVCDLAFIKKNYFSLFIEFWVTLVSKIIRFSFASIWSAVMRKVSRRSRVLLRAGVVEGSVEPLQMPAKQVDQPLRGCCGSLVPTFEHASCSCNPHSAQCFSECFIPFVGHEIILVERTLI